MEKTRTFQLRLFEDLLKVVPKNELVKILSNLLKKQAQDCYRRIRGEYAMSVDELYLLIKGLNDHYKLKFSIDHYFFPPKDEIPFNFNVFEKKIDSFDAYLNQFYDNLNRAKQIDQMVMYYGPNDLPLTFYGFTPKLLAFKMYVYGITLWNFQHLEHRKFSFDLISPEAVKKGRDIANLYLDIPSHEIWKETILESTLNQLIYFTLTDRFTNPNDAIEICDEILQLMRHMQESCESGRKMDFPNKIHKGASFDIYLNYLSNSIDTVFVASPTVEIIFTSFRVPNFLRTTDPKLCQYTKNWIEFVMKKSTQLNVTPIERIQFFNRLEEKIKTAIQKIKSVASVPVYQTLSL